jgi:hypothetical protein
MMLLLLLHNSSRARARRLGLMRGHVGEREGRAELDVGRDDATPAALPVAAAAAVVLLPVVVGHNGWGTANNGGRWVDWGASRLRRRAAGGRGRSRSAGSVR